MKFFLFLLLIGCASVSNNSFSLVNGGMSSSERKTYIKGNGIGFSDESKEAFVEGRIIIGMHKNLVYRLYGEPFNRNFNQWIYKDKSKTYIVNFNNNIVSSTEPEIENWK